MAFRRAVRRQFGDADLLRWREQTRQHVTVALSGDGGDELFAGYDRYRAMRLAARIDRLPQLAGGCSRVRSGNGCRAAGRQKSRSIGFKRLSQLLAAAPGRRYAELIAIFDEQPAAALYSDDFWRNFPDRRSRRPSCWPRWPAAASATSVTAASLADLVTYLPGDLCHKVDIATMAHGLECRQPMLDHRVVELAVAMPSRLKLRGAVAANGFWNVRSATCCRAKSSVARKWDSACHSTAGSAASSRNWRTTRCLARQALGRGYFRRAAIEADARRTRQRPPRPLRTDCGRC